jgi:hypothetical protein
MSKALQSSASHCSLCTAEVPDFKTTPSLWHLFKSMLSSQAMWSANRWCGLRAELNYFQGYSVILQTSLFITPAPKFPICLISKSYLSINSCTLLKCKIKIVQRPSICVSSALSDIYLAHRVFTYTFQHARLGKFRLRIDCSAFLFDWRAENQDTLKLPEQASFNVVSVPVLLRRKGWEPRHALGTTFFSHCAFLFTPQPPNLTFPIRQVFAASVDYGGFYINQNPMPQRITPPQVLHIDCHAKQHKSQPS